MPIPTHILSVYVYVNLDSETLIFSAMAILTVPASIIVSNLFQGRMQNYCYLTLFPMYVSWHLGCSIDRCCLRKWELCLGATLIKCCRLLYSFNLYGE